MLTYMLSDVHVDFYVPQTRNVDILHGEFEKLYERFFLHAEACCLAGDVANDYFTQTEFLKFLSTKYEHVYYVNGNHDLVVSGATCGNGNDFKLSLGRAAKIGMDCDSYGVHVLDGDTVDGIGGTMGMCDLSYRCNSMASIDMESVWRHQWFDGRHWELDGDSRSDMWNLESGKMNNALADRPKVMMTHFCPTQMGIADKYANDICTAFFYFDGHDFLEKMPDGGIWLCGHTHEGYFTEYHTDSGATVKILCNPVGYPDERADFEKCKEEGRYLIEI